MDKSYRSLIKAVTWRITGSLDTFILTFVITSKFEIALSISFFELFTKIFLFWAHERVWNIIGWGKSDKNKSSEFIELNFYGGIDDIDKKNVHPIKISIRKSVIDSVTPYKHNNVPGLIIGHSANTFWASLCTKDMSYEDLMKELENE